MRLPIVAIVGRPNVGKSSLFNMLAGKRISIVDPTAGVTRDRVAYALDLGGRHVEIMDTGGMGIEDHDNLTEDVERQIRFAIEQAAVVVFVVDIRDGVMPLDQTVAERLRSVNKPLIFVANKADEPKIDAGIGELYRLGYGEPICVSANSKRGRDELLSAIEVRLPSTEGHEALSTPELKIAIVGRRNVGKSTFINSLAETERVIVSEIAGTTRDSVDVRFERDGKVFLAIDTAGVRKRRSLATDIEYYGLHRAERSIRRADVVLHLFDPRLRVSRVDKQLTEYILDNHKPAIFVVNKWDLAKDKIPTGKWSDYLKKVFPMLEYVPIAFITAKKGKNVLRLLQLARQLHKQCGNRARTGELNRVMAEAMLANGPPLRNNRQPKMYFAAQVATHPPTIIMVTNGPDLFDRTYVRYLTKNLREHFDFAEVPIRFLLKSKADAAAYGSRKSFLEAQRDELLADEETEEIPVLAEEPAVEAVGPLDDLDDDDFDDDIPPPPKVEPAERPRLEEKPKPVPAPANAAPFGPKMPSQRRRKSKPETWNV